MKKIVYISNKKKYKDSISFLEAAYLYEFGEKCLYSCIKNVFGKPIFKEHTAPCFNLSHSKNLICCVFDVNEIGIDIQFIKAVPTVIMQSYLHSDAIDPLQQTVEWTKFESYYKRIGTGIPLNKRETLYEGNFIISYDVTGYVITVNLKTNDYDRLEPVYL